MALLDEQYEYRGLIFGSGTGYFVNRAEGFDGFEVRTSDSDQPRNDGGLRGLDYVSPRIVAFELAVVAEDDTGIGYEALWAAVRKAFRPSRETDYDLTFKRPGQLERVIRCRPIQLTRVEEFKRFNRYGFPPVVLRAVDPRSYSTAEYVGNVPIYASTGGMELPVVQFPADFIGGTQQEFVAGNAGTANAYPLIRFYGPVTGTCTGVTLRNTTTGDQIIINTDVTAGQILSADMEAAVTGANRLVISLGGSSRYGSWALPRTPFSLAPGSNTLRFEVTGTSTNVVANVIWRDTWID